MFHNIKLKTHQKLKFFVKNFVVNEKITNFALA